MDDELLVGRLLQNGQMFLDSIGDEGGEVTGVVIEVVIEEVVDTIHIVVVEGQYSFL
jgi:hypothetical protein